jgi:hypothetical protein
MQFLTPSGHLCLECKEMQRRCVQFGRFSRQADLRRTLPGSPSTYPGAEPKSIHRYGNALECTPPGFVTL